MLRFKSYVRYLHEAKMTASGDTGARHAEKYLNPEVRNKTTYKLQGNTAGISSGSQVRVHNVTQENGIHYAHISHPSVDGIHKVPISRLHKPSGIGRQEAKAEDHHLRSFQERLESSKLESNTDEITLHTPHGPIRASSVEKVPGTPKADFVVKDRAGKPTYYISHKKGNSPKDFQQWGGATEHRDHPAVQDFVKTLKDRHPEGISGSTVGRELNMNNREHSQLAHRAVFGVQHGGENYSTQNVHSVLAGEMTLGRRNTPGHYDLNASSIIPNIRGKNSLQGKRIVIQARKGDRNDMGLKNTRVTINPVGGRKTKSVDTGQEIK
jgi:hypothetical protein